MQIWQCRSKNRIRAAAFQNHTPFNLIFSSVIGILFPVIHISSSVFTLLQKWAWVLHRKIETVLRWHPQSSPSPSSHLGQGRHGTQRDRQQSECWQPPRMEQAPPPPVTCSGTHAIPGEVFPSCYLWSFPLLPYLPDQCLRQSSS